MVSDDDGDSVDKCVDVSTHTDLTSSMLDDIKDSAEYYKRKTSRMEEDMHPFTEKTFIGDDERVKFYTGLPKFEVL